jgi:hypothetical protein
MRARSFREHAKHKKRGWPTLVVTEGEVGRKWKGLAYSLSGLFCASLNFLVSSPNTLQPKYSFASEGDPRIHGDGSSHLRFVCAPEPSMRVRAAEPSGWVQLRHAAT